MKKNGSYNVESFATNMEAEIRRLNAQVDLFWAVEYFLFQKYGLRDGMDILDCGCGPGRLIELLKENMPQLRCTGLEIDPQLVEIASNMIIKRGLNKCRIIQGNVEKLCLAETSFDFIILRLVLEHVLDPLFALINLSKMLRPGGRLVIISNDFEFHLQTWPPVQQLDQLYKAYCKSRSKDGGDPCIGRRLPQLLAQAGFNLVGYEVEVAHNTIIGDKPFLKAEGAGIPAQLVKTGYLKEEILDEITRSWRKMLSEPDHSIVRPLFVGIGEQSTEKLLSYQSYTVEDDTTQSIKDSIDFKIDIPKGSIRISEILINLISEVLKDKLEEINKNQVEPDDMLIDIGMDSLSALDLQERIQNIIGIEVPILKLLDNVSISDLVKYVDVELFEKKTKLKIDITKGQQESMHWEEGEI